MRHPQGSVLQGRPFFRWGMGRGGGGGESFVTPLKTLKTVTKRITQDFQEIFPQAAADGVIGSCAQEKGRKENLKTRALFSLTS